MIIPGKRAGRQQDPRGMRIQRTQRGSH